MFGHIDSCAAILTAECEALQHAQRDQRDRCDPADLGIGWQKPNQEGRGTHDQDGDEEGVFPADQIAEATEDQRTERAHQEAGSEGQQREDVAGVDVERGKELRANDRGQRTVKVKVVPLENRAERGGQDDLFLASGHGTRSACGPDCCHAHGVLLLLLPDEA